MEVKKNISYHFILNIILSFFLFMGCSSLRSGGYVQYKNQNDLKKLAAAAGVSVSEIKFSNRNKKFKKGEWIFVPTKKGFGRVFFSKIKRSLPKMAGTELLWPVPSSTKISSFYKGRRRPNHLGLDIPAKRGTHILAAADGVVHYSGNGLRGYGNLIILKHSHKMFTVYAHAKKNFVKKGQKVFRGQVISKVGSTGKSTGPHLHFEVRLNNKPIDPLPYLQRGRKLASRK